MAHAAYLQQLTEKLTRNISLDVSTTSVQATKETAYRRLRPTNHARTNPFEVKSQLDGLVEKFSIKGREDLATSLQFCLDELPPSTQWIPEALSLLLELSDHPTEKVRPEDLVRAVQEDAATPALTWSDILAQDPLGDEDELWQDVDRGYHSSGDEQSSVGEDYDPTASSQATSVDELDPAAFARSHIIQPDLSLLQPLQLSQERRHQSSGPDQSTILSELELIRETLDMLNGLPTSIYALDQRSGQIQVGQANLATTNSLTLQHFQTQCAALGTDLGRLRAWIGKEHQVATVQAMQSSVGTVFEQFHAKLHVIATNYLQSNSPVNISILDVKSEIDAGAGGILALAYSICQQSENDMADLSLLDRLYDSCCIAQLSGDAEAFATLCSVLLRGYQAYLPSLEHWIRTGVPSPRNIKSSLVALKDSHCPLGDMWNERFALQLFEDGTPRVSKALKPFARRIYSSGRSQALLGLLQQPDRCQTDDTEVSPPLDLAAVQSRLRNEPLMPFSQLFEEKLGNWFASASLGTDTALKLALNNEPAIWQTLADIEEVFFGRDGSKVQSLAESLLTAREAFLDDPFLLTELVQAVFSPDNGMDPSRLSVGLSADARRTRLERVGRLLVGYRLPWLFENISKSSELMLHSSIFSLLLQFQCAKLRLQSTFSGRTGPELTQVTELRHKLLWFLNVMVSHISSTASTLHSTLISDMRSASGIDDLSQRWSEYEKRLDLCLLLTGKCKPVRTAMMGILELSERFVDSLKTLREEPQSLTLLSADVERSLAFIQAGVRGISRAAGQPTLVLLSSSLEWQHQ